MLLALAEGLTIHKENRAVRPGFDELKSLEDDRYAEFWTVNPCFS